MAEPIRLFVHGSCAPCQEIKKLIESGKFDKEEVEVIDIATEEGYHWMEKMKLTRVPSAFHGSQECKLRIDDEKEALLIECPGDTGGS
jgi:hypothetical protein